jgi:hypothetical protein
MEIFHLFKEWLIFKLKFLLGNFQKKNIKNQENTSLAAENTLGLNQLS